MTSRYSFYAWFFLMTLGAALFVVFTTAMSVLYNEIYGYHLYDLESLLILSNIINHISSLLGVLLVVFFFVYLYEEGKPFWKKLFKKYFVSEEVFE